MRLENPVGGKSDVTLSADRKVASKRYDGEKWQMDAMLKIWRTASKMGVAPPVLKATTIDTYNYRVDYKFVDGVDLFKHFDTMPKAERKAEFLKVMAGMRSLLAKIHAKGIVFGDVHPGNVIIQKTGRMWLIDWDGAVCTRDDITALKWFKVLVAGPGAGR